MAIYFKFDGADGGGTDKGYEKWIVGIKYDVLGTRQLMGAGAGGSQMAQQRTTGSTQLGPIELHGNIDKATPKIVAACLGGKIVKKVEVVETTTVGGKSELNSHYEFSDVLVTLVETVGDGRGNQNARYQLMPTKVKMKYQEIDPKDGSVKGSVEGEADVMAMTAK
ncbi:MAG: type VI secretion system tube protein Hcp [Planctomycetaceae bacterium]|jgi:type VI protein secretion system component Hcp